MFHVRVKFILIFHKAYNYTLSHAGLINIYQQLHVFDSDQATKVPAIDAFEAQVHTYLFIT